MRPRRASSPPEHPWESTVKTALLGSSLQAQSPRAEQINAKHLATRGGVEKLKSITVPSPITHQGFEKP